MSRSFLVLLYLVSWPMHAWAVDSYRYLHVTIDTPWMIFLGLAIVVLLPFIVLVVLYWYYAGKHSEERSSDGK